MPKLKVLIACRQVLKDLAPSANELSFIGVIGFVNPTVPEGTSLPSDSAVPFSWNAVMLWDMIEKEYGKEYRVKIELIPFGGANLLPELVQTFNPSEASQTLIAQVNGFPVGHEGLHNLVTSLWDEERSQWQEMGSYEITVRYNRNA